MDTAAPLLVGSLRVGTALFDPAFKGSLWRAQLVRRGGCMVEGYASGSDEWTACMVCLLFSYLFGYREEGVTQEEHQDKWWVTRAMLFVADHGLSSFCFPQPHPLHSGWGCRCWCCQVGT